MMQVLQTRQQIADARRRLSARNVSTLESPLKFSVKQGLRRIGIDPGPSVGDWIKSWDVERTLDFIAQHVPPDQPILDIGCYSSEVLVALHRMGFKDLHGADLNPRLRRMPHADAIDYRVTDFMHSGFSDGSFAAVTAISVIEHGFNGPRLFSEVSRLLKSGGYFIASFDYWPEKIDTTGTTFFDLDWRIFSAQEVEGMLVEAARHGLVPVAALDLQAREKAIEHGGFRYTFGWFVLEKRA
jgi:SAM-dependent methyltransferase